MLFIDTKKLFLLFFIATNIYAMEEQEPVLRLTHRNDVPIAMQVRLENDRRPATIQQFPDYHFFQLGLDITSDKLKTHLHNFNRKEELVDARLEIQSGKIFNEQLKAEHPAVHNAGNISPISPDDRVAVITLNLCGQPAQRIVMQISRENPLRDEDLKKHLNERFKFIKEEAQRTKYAYRNELASALKKCKKTFFGQLCFEKIPVLTYSLCQYIAEDILDDLKASIGNTFSKKHLEEIKAKVAAPNAQTITDEINTFKKNKMLNDTGKIVAGLDEQHPMTSKLEAAFCKNFENSILKGR